ncbi:MAG: LysR substrate-binding domain-containing protein [Chitinophagales bacterium]|nr:LysR substrate-binding domain-containing protein [Chitinophagales bacterium]
MNLQQLEYIIAIDSYRHFAKAAEKCFVTQPTLSMMVQKLEEELDVKIFDRTSQPVKPTPIGEQIIEQARKTLADAKRITELVKENKGEISGELRLAIIPTLAPYLLPLFLKNFSQQYPQVRLIISERITPVIISQLKTGELDMGLLATPLHEPILHEQPLFYEELMLYVADNEALASKQYVLPKDIDVHKLWLLQEGHCLRSQIMNLCELKRSDAEVLQYEAGSIETLKNIVDRDNGMTIIPELATLDLAEKTAHIRHFQPPAPVREISLVSHKDDARASLRKALFDTVQQVLPTQIRRKGDATKSLELIKEQRQSK